MAALELLQSEKLAALVDSRNKAKEAWLTLENEYNKLDPSLKPA